MFHFMRLFTSLGVVFLFIHFIYSFIRPLLCFNSFIFVSTVRAVGSTVRGLRGVAPYCPLGVSCWI